MQIAVCTGAAPEALLAMDQEVIRQQGSIEKLRSKMIRSVVGAAVFKSPRSLHHVQVITGCMALCPGNRMGSIVCGASCAGRCVYSAVCCVLSEFTVHRKWAGSRG